MKRYEYDIPLPSKQKELLLSLVNISKRYNVLSFRSAIHKPNEPPYFFTLLDYENSTFELPEDPIPGFEELGFIKVTDEKIDQKYDKGSGNTTVRKTGERTVFLMPNLFKWANYEKKNQMMKWIERNPNIIRDFGTGIAFILSLILSIKEIIEYFTN